jgi:hypothetical protein
MNKRRSPEKLATWLVATKLYTVIEPFGPLNSFQLIPAIVGVAIGEPVLEIGPAPPRAASHIMISYSSDPAADDDENMS